MDMLFCRASASLAFGSKDGQAVHPPYNEKEWQRGAQ
jgi:hypothetical protein